MAKKRQKPAKPAKPARGRAAKPARAARPSPALTPERFARLYRMVQLLSGGPVGRGQVARKLHLDVRGFYRDLELLRSAGIAVSLSAGLYGLDQAVDHALALLPFPDPHLTLGEVQTLAKGRTQTHRKLNEAIERAVPS